MISGHQITEQTDSHDHVTSPFGNISSHATSQNTCCVLPCFSHKDQSEVDLQPRCMAQVVYLQDHLFSVLQTSVQKNIELDETKKIQMKAWAC